jgi:hypothetical protein
MIRALLSFALCSTFVGPAFAQSLPTAGWSLQWHAPPSCPSEAAVQAEVRSLLEGSTRSDVALAISGDALEVNEGFEVELRFSSKEGPAQRVLTSRDCKEVAKAAALVIALAVDPGVKIDPNRSSTLEKEAPLPKEQTSPQKEQPPAPRPAPKSPPKKKGTPRAVKPLPVSIELALGGAIELGTLPSPALGGRAAVSVGVGSLRGTLAADLFPARIYDADQSTRLRMSLWSGSALLGYAIALDRHAVTPQLGARLGKLDASARDAAAPIDADSLAFGPELGIVGSLRPFGPLHTLGPLGFWLGLHSGLNLVRPRLIVQNRGLAHQPGVLWGTAALGISLAWP